MSPVLIVLDAGPAAGADHGERAQSLCIPKLRADAPPQGDSGAVREAARLLVNAQNPVIVADRAARTPNGMKLARASSPKPCRRRSSIRAAA